MGTHPPVVLFFYPQLRTPLHAIIALSSLALEEGHLEPSVEDFIRGISTASSTLLWVINQARSSDPSEAASAPTLVLAALHSHNDRRLACCCRGARRWQEEHGQDFCCVLSSSASLSARRSLPATRSYPQALTNCFPSSFPSRCRLSTVRSGCPCVQILEFSKFSDAESESSPKAALSREAFRLEQPLSELLDLCVPFPSPRMTLSRVVLAEKRPDLLFVLPPASPACLVVGVCCCGRRSNQHGCSFTHHNCSVGPKAIEAGVEIVCDADLALCKEWLLGDPFRVRQILVNLVDNVSVAAPAPTNNRSTPRQFVAS